MSWHWQLRRSSPLLPFRASPALSDSDADRPPDKQRWRRRLLLRTARQSHSILLALLVVGLSVVLAVAATLLWAVPSGSQKGAPQDNRLSTAPQLSASPHSATASTSPSGELSLLLCPATPDSHVLPRGFEWLPSPQQSQRCGSVDSHGRATQCDAPPTADSHFTLRRGTGYGLPETQYSRNVDVERRWDSSYTESETTAMRERLQWMSEYDFHNATQRTTRLPKNYQSTTAPWYEVSLSPTGRGAGWRLTVHEAQWRLSSPHAAKRVEGVDIIFTIVPVAAYWDTVEQAKRDTLLSYSYTNSTLTAAALDGMRCSFTADELGDVQTVENAETAEDVRTAAALINEASSAPVTFTENPFLLGGGVTHHVIHCPLPSLPRHVHSLLINHASSATATSRLHLSSISLHLDERHSSAFGFSVLTLPLCLLRHRRVGVALVLSTQLGPPHLLHPLRLHAFVAYHMFLGVELFIVPERFGPLLDALLPYIAMGALWYVRQPFPVAVHQPYLDQVPVLHSCVLRLQYAAEWVLSVDVDEYITFDHPYWTEGEGVQPPSDDCWLSISDQAVDGGSAAGCRSLLSAFLSQPGFDQLSLFSLANVPHWGLAHSVNETLQSLSSSPFAATAYLRSLHPLDVWTRRSYGSEKYRFKLLFRPSHIRTVTMHEATLRPDCCWSGVGGGVVDAWEKYWGDAGLQQHKETILHNALTETPGVDMATLLEQQEEQAEVYEDEHGNVTLIVRVPELSAAHEAVRWHPQLRLLDLLCTAEMRERSEVQLSFDLSCCDLVDTTNNCFVEGAASFSSYLLATLTPLFPTVAQSNPFSPTHPALPHPLPEWSRPLPLSLFGSHISHFVFSHKAAVELPHCTAANRSLRMEAMWGESHRAGIAFEAEDGEERSKVKLRAQFKQWSARPPWVEQARAVPVEIAPDVASDDL